MIDSTQQLAGVDSDPRELLGFRFPTAELVAAAAALFDRPGNRQERGYARVLDGWSERATELLPGSWPELRIAPGMVEYRRFDRSQHDRARAAEQARLSDAWRRRKLEHDRATFGPMAFALTPAEIADLDAPKVVRPRGQIVAWSSRSRARLVKSIVSLDLAPLVSADRLPVMLTLTLPDNWLTVAPDGEAAARIFDRFRRAWAHRFGAPAWLWKREFQRRGAPHWHLWLVPPVELGEFREWLAGTWADAIANPDPEHDRRSRLAGTNVSQADGMAARDPKRLAIYFLKESLGGEGKAYQNAAPAQWRGKTIGRFWGVAGLRPAVATVELDPSVTVQLWRVLRHVRRSKGVTRRQLVERINQSTGEVRYRAVRRRVAARASAGWVAVNDGPALASQLARWLSTL